MSSEDQQVPYIPKERKGVIPLKIWPYHSFPSPLLSPFVLLCVKKRVPQDTFEKSGQVERESRKMDLSHPERDEFRLFRFLFLFCFCFLAFDFSFCWTFGFGSFSFDSWFFGFHGGLLEKWLLKWGGLDIAIFSVVMGCGLCPCVGLFLFCFSSDFFSFLFFHRMRRAGVRSKWIDCLKVVNGETLSLSHASFWRKC